MRADLINPFIESVNSVLKTMAQTEATSGKPSVKNASTTPGEVSGIIGMAGDTITGNMMVSFDSPCILAIVNRMLMDQFTEINNDVVDAVGELTNMICGGTKKILNDKGMKFEMASPIIILGANVEVKQLSKAPVISVPFSTPEGTFVIESNLHARV